MSLKPEVWGESAWNLIHLIAYEYPLNPSPDDQLHHFNFYSNLQYILPCSVCRAHYSEYIKKQPLSDYALSSRSALLRWTIDLHNAVNKRLGKKVFSYNASMNKISQLAHGKDKTNTHTILFMVIVFIALMIFIIGKTN